MIGYAIMFVVGAGIALVLIELSIEVWSWFDKNPPPTNRPGGCW